MSTTKTKDNDLLRISGFCKEILKLSGSNLSSGCITTVLKVLSFSFFFNY